MLRKYFILKIFVKLLKYVKKNKKDNKETQ